MSNNENVPKKPILWLRCEKYCCKLYSLPITEDDYECMTQICSFESEEMAWLFPDIKIKEGQEVFVTISLDIVGLSKLKKETCHVTPEAEKMRRTTDDCVWNDISCILPEEDKTVLVHNSENGVFEAVFKMDAEDYVTKSWWETPNTGKKIDELISRWMPLSSE